MKKKLLTGFGLMAVLALSPSVAHAQDGFGGIITKISNLINQLIPLVIGLALLVFLWGVLSYALAKEDGGKDAAKGYMLWGIIALFVMVSVWGLVNIVQDTFLEATDASNLAPSAPTTPKIPS